jgi:hypothetical protein
MGINSKGAPFAQAVDQLRDPGARPRPLAEPFKAGVVNIDDTDRRIGPDPRRTALEFIEGYQPHALDRRRVHNPDDDRQGEQRQRQQTP